MSKARYIIHVNRQNIAMNAKDGGRRPAYIVRGDGQTRYAIEVEVNGPSRMVYGETPLSCGARAWIETDADVVLTGACTFAESRAMAA